MSIIRSITRSFAPPNEIREDHAMEPHDAGWRKYSLVIFAMCLLSVGLYWTGDSGIAREILERRSISYVTFAEFTVGLVGLYFGANVTYKAMAGTRNVAAMKTKAEAEAAKTAPPTTTPGAGKAS